MKKDTGDALEGVIITPDGKVYQRISDLVTSDSQGWGVSLLLGTAASGVAFLTPEFSHEGLIRVVISSLVGVGTTMAVRERTAAALAAGYLGYEFVASAAATTGQVVGLCVGAAAGAMIGSVGEPRQYPSRAVIGAGLGAVTGYFSGGLTAAASAILLCAAVGGSFRSRKTIGLVAATALGYFGATTAIEKNILPQLPTFSQVTTAQVARL